MLSADDWCRILHGSSLNSILTLLFSICAQSVTRQIDLPATNETAPSSGCNKTDTLVVDFFPSGNTSWQLRLDFSKTAAKSPQFYISTIALRVHVDKRRFPDVASSLVGRRCKGGQSCVIFICCSSSCFPVIGLAYHISFTVRLLLPFSSISLTMSVAGLFRSLFFVLSLSYADTPQFCGGNPYFFSENPYQSVPFIYASMYRENVHAIHIAMQFAKNRDIVL